MPLRATLLAIVAPLSGGLSLTLATDPPTIVFVPAGPLAAQLAAVADVGEVWELTLADDGATVVGARFCAELSSPAENEEGAPAAPSSRRVPPRNRWVM